MLVAAGEYVSVRSNTDAEQAVTARETGELAETPDAEWEKLPQIQGARGLDRDLAAKAAIGLTERNALATPARDELIIFETVTVHPIQAAQLATKVVGTTLVEVVMPRGPAPVKMFALILFDISTVRLHYLAQICGGDCGRDYTGETDFHHFWQTACMVDTRIGQDHSLDSYRVEREGVIGQLIL